MGRHHNHDKCRKTRRQTCKGKCIPICKEDFGCHRNETYVIHKPGYYCLKQNITYYSPLWERSQAIVIDSDDVVLDLCGHVLEQGNDVTFCIGVRVKTGHQNVTVLGSYGAIRQFSQVGIYVEGGNKDIKIGDSDTTLDINECGGGGEWGSSAVPPEGGPKLPCLQGAMILGETMWRAKWGSFTSFYDYHGPITNLSVINVKADRNQGGYIINQGNGTNVLYRGVSASDNVELREVGIQFPPHRATENWVAGRVFSYPGIDTINSEGIVYEDFLDTIVFDDCDFNRNYTGPSSSGGLSVNDGLQINNTAYNVTIKNSRFNGNESVGELGVPGESGPDITLARGCVVSGVSCATLENVEACGNKATIFAEGLHFSGFIEVPLNVPNVDNFRPVKSLTLRNCKASDNQARWEAFGFRLLLPIGAELIDCVAENNICLVEPELDQWPSTARGLFVNAGQKNIAIRGCKFTNNYTDSKNKFEPFLPESTGILSTGTETLSITDCIFSDNQDLGSELGERIEQGVQIDTTEYPTLKNNIFTNHVTANASGIRFDNTLKGIIQDNELNGNEVGIRLVNSECNVVRGNLLVNNNYGIRDAADPTTNLMVENKAFNTRFESYDFTPKTVVSGSIADFPDTNGKVCSNIDFTKDAALSVELKEVLSDKVSEFLQGNDKSKKSLFFL